MENLILSKEELLRYSRHIIIPEFGLEGQQKLKTSSVLVVGTGGLGSPLLLYLVAAGVGKIGIIDFDILDETNLQRQVLFNREDVGKPKAEVAMEKLAKLNQHIELVAYNEELTSDNALDIIREYDVVADGTDNFPTRYLVNDACVLLGKTNVYASIFRFEGQVSVFNHRYEDGSSGPNYRDLFPEPPPPGFVPSCAEGGVLGVLPGIIGSLQANEVIKVLTGVGDPLAGRLFLFDAQRFESRTLKVKKNPTNPLTGENPSITELIDYEHFCGLDDPDAGGTHVDEISVHELKEMLDSGADIQLVDVREEFEFHIANLGEQTILIPLSRIGEEYDRIAKDRKVVLFCRSGIRSRNAIVQLKNEYGFDNLANLSGGILSWARELDPEMTQY